MNNMWLVSKATLANGLLCTFYNDYLLFSVCTTISGPSTNQRCVLPFKFNGVTHRKCPIDPDNSNLNWCSTKIDQNGQHISGIGAYGNCGPNCPLVSGRQHRVEEIRSRSLKSNSNNKNRKSTRRRSSK